MVTNDMKYDKDLRIGYLEVEKKFKIFLDKYECWGRATNKVLEEYNKEFKRDKRTFQRWRKNLLLNVDMFKGTEKYRKNIDRNSECYFCETKKELQIHHKDKNRQNNDKNNLLILCPKCHHRLHLLLDKKHNHSDINGLPILKGGK